MPSLSNNKLTLQRTKLLARIHRKFQTIDETHAVGPLRLKFTRVLNPDAVLDQIVQQEDAREKLTGDRRDGNDLHLPYWAELWDSAIGIAAHLTNRKSQIQNRKSILDLGCGMGFAGMVASALGAKVMLADLEADALLFARLNTLQWNSRVRQLNWQRNRLNEKFDLILGADVLYDRSQWDYLDTFFRAHLRKNGAVLLGEPGRQTGEMFPTWIEQRGWNLTHIAQKIPTRKTPIRIFELAC
jgi:predicted nicotinamide N-methyase